MSPVVGSNGTSPPSALQEHFHLAGSLVLTLGITIAINVPRLDSANNLFTFGGFNGWPSALYARLLRGDLLYRDVVWPLPPVMPWLYGALASVRGPGLPTENLLSLISQVVIALTTFLLCRQQLRFKAPECVVSSIAAGTMSVLAHQTSLHDAVSLAFGWLAIVTAIKALTSNSRTHFLCAISGACGGLSGFAKQSIGAFVVLACLLVVGCFGASFPARWKSVLFFLSGVAVCALGIAGGLAIGCSLAGFVKYVVIGGISQKGGTSKVFLQALDFLRFPYLKFQAPAFATGMVTGIVIACAHFPDLQTMERSRIEFDERYAFVGALAVMSLWGVSLNMLDVNHWARAVRILQFGILVLQPLVVGLAIGGGGVLALTRSDATLVAVLCGALALASSRCISGDMVFNYEATAMGFLPVAISLAKRCSGILRRLVHATIATAALMGTLSVSAHNSVFLNDHLGVPVRDGLTFAPAGEGAKAPARAVLAVNRLSDLVKAGPCPRGKPCRCVVFSDPVVSLWLDCVEDQRSLVWYTDMFDDSLFDEEVQLLVAHPPSVVVLPRGTTDAGVDSVIGKLRTLRANSASERLYRWLDEDFLPALYIPAGTVDVTGMNGYSDGPVSLHIYWRRDPV